MISFLVFHGNIVKSQRVFLNKIPSHSTILWIGGGSGKVLPQLLDIKKQHHIDYIEASEKMLLRAKKTGSSLTTSRGVQFIHGDHTKIPDKEYDVIVTFFFLDLFKKNKSAHIFDLIDSKLKSNGLWLYADFTPSKHRKHRLLEKIMFYFLKAFTHIENNKIEDHVPLFKEFFTLKMKSVYYDGYIVSSVYQKN